MKKLTSSFSKYRNALKIRKDKFLTDEQEEIIEQKSIDEAEKALEELEKEEDKARSKMIAQLKEVFFDLPTL